MLERFYVVNTKMNGDEWKVTVKVEVDQPLF